MFKGRKVLVAVTGSIAAYKSAFLVRLLVKSGALVRVVMTPSAKDFITPLTLSTLSKNPVLADFTKNSHGEWNNHVDLALWADIMIIAPASANTLAKMAGGGCDNLLLATYLSSRCPVYVAPAMDEDMYRHPSTSGNLKKIKSFGNHIIDPGKGELASGLYGEGRMAEPEEIMDFILKDIKKKLPLTGKKALVTAGPTYEAIDPVRFIGNYSSGKMGFAIASELACQGADVTLVCGPNSLSISTPGIKRIDVVSADDMYRACIPVFENSDIAVCAAAVADYAPAYVAKQKIKKQQNSVPKMELKQTKDILSELGRRKKKNQFLVGFALETENGIENARQKLKKKNLDFIVLNSLNETGDLFGSDKNKIMIIDKNNKTSNFELKHKQQVAMDIVGKIIDCVSQPQKK